MSQDTLRLQILDDGTIKSTADGISASNHRAAEEFLALLTQFLGGAVTRERRKDAHQHQHVQGQAHEHA